MAESFGVRDFCSPLSLFWESNYSTPWPDFTLCFQDFVILNIPAVFLILISLLHIPSLIKSPEFHPKFGKKIKSSLYHFKLYCSAAMIIPPMVDLLYTLTDVQVRPVAGVLMVTPCLTWIAMNVMPEGFLRYIACCIVFGGSVVMLVQTIWVDRSYKKEQIDCKEDDLEPNPESRASFLSKISFWWLNGLIIKGYKHPLTDQDLWDLNEVDKCSNIGNRFRYYWTRELAKISSANKDGVTITTAKNPSLVLAFGRTFGSTFIFAGVLKVTQDTLSFVAPQILRALIAFTADASQPMWQGFAYAFMMFAITFIQSCTNHQFYHRCFVTSIRLKSTIIWAVYRKSLVLSNSSRKSSATGEIINLVSVDAQKLSEAVLYLHMVWAAPIQISLATYFLWQELGPSVMAGLGVLILLVPINAYISTKQRDFQARQMKFKDTRTKLMNEVLNGIKVLKLYAWEKSFIKKVLDIRKLELRQLFISSVLHSAVYFTWANAPFLVALATFTTYVLSGNTLTASKAFVSISLFNVLSYPITTLPASIAVIIQASVSLKRLSDFLKLHEMDESNVNRSMPPKFDRSSVVIEKGNFKWGADEKETILHNVDFEVPAGSLVAVVGHVGGGKSSLLSAILGEMDKVAGDVYVKGSIAYVPQQAWMQNGTIEENILFGQDQLVARYNKTIEACALIPDLEILPGGDQCEIGEKGINLSGGQKQRISVARAVYSNSDIYMFDDPLSAVDAHTRILVTHGLNFLPSVDKIIVVEEGKITETGTFDELLARQGSFSEFFITYANTKMNRPQEELDINEEIEIDEIPQLTDELLQRLKSTTSQLDRSSFSGSREGLDLSKMSSVRQESKLYERGLSTISQRQDKVTTTEDDHNLILKQIEAIEEKKKLIQEEKTAVGRVKFAVFLHYMKSLGRISAIVIILSKIVIEGCSVGANVWLAEWSSITNSTDSTRNLYLGIYGAFGASKVFISLLNSLLLAYAAVHAGGVLHSALLQNVLRLPMSFFETNPTGRIINRFSTDIFIIDEVIPLMLIYCIGISCTIVGILLVICISTPLFIVVVLPLGIIYFFTQPKINLLNVSILAKIYSFFCYIKRFYIATSRQLKRLDSKRRSPIYSHLGETLEGTTTIRGYGAKDRFCIINDKKVDLNAMAYYPNMASNRWLAIRLEFIGNCVVLFSAIFAIIGRNSLPAAIVGLSVSYAMQITETLNWMVRMSSELESNIVSVERIKEYTEIPTEASWDVSEIKLDSEWPPKGDIQFINYKTRYRDGLDLILKGINCNISASEKIGIIGRTGAGKSSLTLALFRIIEAADGIIMVDNVDISKIGLHYLRSRITIIPQDPVLFAGILRMNLDPFDEYNDNDIWGALENAHLKNFVISLEDNLKHTISEGGKNLSVGQRQLICLARALLRKTKILVLDEATAAVDAETDELIQTTIRREFIDCTILTIAHRINTIMDSTRVMVLDQGQIAEFDPPAALLARKDSVFYSMAKDANLI
ncbi:Multidrug resistance-associated protein 1 [Trichoplax sp. H2]|nr:Multidrug resistance-associated protein 1 [Trichoplax sp. H2]|eukprot:RDD40608.1 Multidrug resistance-associated protein 1 [Trichoplax sp. H2]